MYDNDTNICHLRQQGKRIVMSVRVNDKLSSRLFGFSLSPTF